MRLYHLALALSLCSSPASPSRASAANSTVNGNTAFALDLYKQLNSGDGNLFFSPYSISTCLAMTCAGARGNTEVQMARAFHFDTNQAKMHAAFGDLQKHLNDIQSNKEVELNIANGLWAQQGQPFLSDFLNIATKDYEAKLEQADFHTQAEATRKKINDWVSDRTKGKIADLIAPGALNDMTRLVLVNAIYFKGKWIHQFKKEQTVNAPFLAANDQKVQAKMMNLRANFNYAETDKMQLLELAYAGGRVSLMVLLPKGNDGLKALEDSLNPKRLDDWLDHTGLRQVNVFFPKFKLTQGFALSHTLAAMGMTDAFSSKSDFSGMDGQRDLFISAVIHKAFVDVNEEGTEAAAATGVVMEALAVRRPEPAVTFRADHPFLFLLRDRETGSILFMGRVTDPTK